MRNSILLTGGAGYIGSHTYTALVQAGATPIILDNFSNSHPAVLERLVRITGHKVVCERGDVSDTAFVQDVLARHAIAAVIHFAGFKAVGESVSKPLDYYCNNLGGTLSLLQAMEATCCRALVFSSSATVYGNPASVPIAEDSPRTHTSPYGHTKLVCEDILTAMRTANPAWRIGILRYFNPVGAHPSGLIGEDPAGTPNNLMPYMAQVAVGKQPYLNVYGNDYPTPDGTGVRDYIHVMDLAKGHVAAVNALLRRDEILLLISAPVWAIACWMWCVPSSRPVASQFRTGLFHAAQVMWQSVTPMCRLQPACLAGGLYIRWLICAKTHGAGRKATPMVTHSGLEYSARAQHILS